MELSNILSITGKPGLFKLIAQTKTGLIVESLSDKKRFPTHIADKINKLEDITVYQNTEDITLKEVFEKIAAKQNFAEVDALIKNDDKKLKAFFEEVLPDYDKEKVYVSDMKKIVAWYNVLQNNNLLKSDEKEENKPGETEVNTAEE